MLDVYAPEFAGRVDTVVGKVAREYAGNPYCIGYFVDNEMGWSDVRQHTLGSPPSQPCRVELIRRLHEERSVLIVPGDHFGLDHHLRISFGLPETYLTTALDRIASLIDEVRSC